jgi:hypothetical protein
MSDLESAVENFSVEESKLWIEKLEKALHDVSLHPEDVPRDHTVSEPVLHGRLILAGLYLSTGNKAKASESMDAAIRTARDQALPAEAYGPQVDQLYRERKAALEAAGTATIAITCLVACEIVIEQRLLPDQSETLLLGTYSVWINATEADVKPMSRSIVLDEAGATIDVVFGKRESPQVEPTPGRPYVHMTMPLDVGGATLSHRGGKVICTSPCDSLVDPPFDRFIVGGPNYQPSKPFRLPPGALAYELTITPVKRGKKIAVGQALIGLGAVGGALLAFMPMIVNTPKSGAIASWTLSVPVLVVGIAVGSVLIKRGRTKVEVVPRPWKM